MRRERQGTARAGTSGQDTAGGRAEADAYSAPALEKGLDILEALANEVEGLKLSALAQRLGRSSSELYRMLVCLTRRGYVARAEESDRYTLTLRLFELAHRHPPMQRLIGAALPLMRALAASLDQSCHLSVFHEGRQLVVAQVDAPGAMGFGVRLGANGIDLLMSASGRVLLAFQDATQRAWMLESYYAAGGMTRLRTLALVLARVRADGYAEMDSVQVAGVHAISFPVLDVSGRAVASLTVPYLSRLDDQTRASIADSREALRAASRRLSLAMGSRTPLAAAVLNDDPPSRS
jgi:DNA-binding IclR family transcriptional regulator